MAVGSTHMTSYKFLTNIRLFISLKVALFVKTVTSAARSAVQKFQVK